MFEELHFLCDSDVSNQPLHFQKCKWEYINIVKEVVSRGMIEIFFQIDNQSKVEIIQTGSKTGFDPYECELQNNYLLDVHQQRRNV